MYFHTETNKGVCQDYAHVMPAISRTWGIPSRYVSGYMHVTSVANERHVRIAVAEDYLDVSPTRGVLIDGEPSNLEATVKMQIVPSSVV